MTEDTVSQHIDATPARRLLGVTPWVSSWLGALSLCTGVILYALIPETAAFQMVGCTAIPVWWLIYQTKTLAQPVAGHLLPPGFMWDALRLAAFACWMAISALWAPHATPALHIAVTFGLYLLCLGVWVNFEDDRTVDQDLDPVRRRLGQALVLGYCIALPLIVFEAATNLAGRNAIATAFPALRPGSHHMTVSGAGMVSLNPYMLNRSIAAVVFLAWPVLLIAHTVLPRAWRTAAVAVLAALTAACVLVGQHGSSRLAFGAGVLMFALASWRALAARRLALTLWTVVSLLVVPLAAAAYRAELFRIDALPYSSAHRILIWGYTANDVLRRPFTGVGAASTRFIEQMEKPVIVRTAKFAFPVSVNVHAHNVYLQVWFELGAIGALLFWFAGLPVIGWISNASAAIRPALYAAWATAVAMASTSYSLTDPWFMASFCLLAVFARLAVSLRR